MNYFNLTIAANPTDCPENHKTCGRIDTLNNVLCLPIDETCPINFFEIIQKHQPMPKGFNYSTIELNNATIVYSNNNFEGDVLVYLKVEEGLPCANGYYKNYAYPPFIAEKYYDRYKCLKGIWPNLIDSTYQLKDVYSYYKLYKENGILSLLDEFSGFKNYSTNLELSNRNMHLFSKKYVGIRSNLHKKIRESFLAPDFLKYINEMHDLITADEFEKQIIALIIFQSVIILASISKSLYYCTCEKYYNDHKDTKAYHNLMKFYYISKILFISVFIMSIIFLCELIYSNEGLKFFVNANDHDEDDIFYMILAQRILNKYYNFSWAIIAMQIIIILISPAFLTIEENQSNSIEKNNKKINNDVEPNIVNVISYHQSGSENI
jgi:hypothetical protein